MKIMKMIYPVALALTLVATGCKHEPGPVTKLPGPSQTGINDQNNQNTLPPGNPIDQGGGVVTQPGGGPAAATELWGDMAMDRAALAAYTVYFAYDSAAVKKSEQSNLQAVTQALAGDMSAKLLIEGDCDERGTEEYNRALGERRALALREALAKLGLDPMRVRTVSYGKDKPADTGHDESAWSKNRRGEFILLHPKSSS